MFLSTLWDEIEKLSPDTATVERCFRLASNRYVKETGVCNGYIWGKIKTSGASYYSVCWQLESFSSYSNSPINQNPDKYLLALAYYYCKNPETFPSFDKVPTWVLNGQSKNPLTEKELIEKEKEKELLREKNFTKRQTEMLKGISVLTLWIEDSLRMGFARLREQPISFWESIASQLTDFKLNGISAKVDKIFRQRDDKDWIQTTTKRFGELIIYCEAFQKWDDFQVPVQQDLLIYGGVSIKKEEVAKEFAHKDEWLVCSVEFRELNIDLTSRTVWLWGLSTNLFANILSYSWRSEKWEDTLLSETKVSGNIHFYPSAYPQRAIFLNQEEAIPFKNKFPKGSSNWRSFFDSFRAAYLQQFLLDEFPGVIEELTVINEGSLYLRDKVGIMIEVDPKFDEKWELIAYSRETIISVFGVWNGLYFFPKRYV